MERDMPRPYAPQAYHHAPADARFTLEDIEIDFGAEILEAFDAKTRELEREELEAMTSHNDRKAARIRDRLTAIALRRDFVEEAMNEASLDYVPTAKEIQESLDEDNGRDAA
jgi:hypothetical protein